MEALSDASLSCAPLDALGTPDSERGGPLSVPEGKRWTLKASSRIILLARYRRSIPPRSDDTVPVARAEPSTIPLLSHARTSRLPNAGREETRTMTNLGRIFLLPKIQYRQTSQTADSRILTPHQKERKKRSSSLSDGHT